MIGGVSKMKKCRLTVIFCLCCSLMLTTFVGCADTSLLKQTQIKPIDSSLSDKAIILDYDDAPNAYKAEDEKIQILKSMSLALENEYLQLYVGSFYDIAVLDKASGEVFFSNELAYSEQEDWSDQRIAAARSQLNIEYYGASNSYFSKTSYPDCLNNNGENQITVNTADGKTIVTYQFGEAVDSKIFCRAITQEAFEKLEETAQSFIDSGELSSFEWRKFKGFYDEVVFEKLNDADKKKYTESHANIKKLKTIYVMRRGISETQKNQISKISKLLGIDVDFINQQEDTIGFINEDENVTAFFEIPVVYQLQGRDLVVSIDFKNIKDTEDFKLTKIQLLPCFGATSQNSEGYVFLPDGSGAIIENNVFNEYFSKYEFPFYGSDYGIDILDAADIKPNNVFPVFGIRTNQSSVFAIVESGDAIGGISAQIGNKEIMYNTACAWFTYYAQDKLYLNGLTSKDASSYSFVYPNTPNTDECRVRYHFLYGDDSTYSGMAKYYQKYLTQTETLEEKEISTNLKLDLNFVGSIKKKKTVLGVPVDASAAASDYKSVEAFLKKLNDKNIENYNVVFDGALNGGMDSSVANTAKLESVLGSEKEYESFKNYIDGSNNSLSFNIDFSRVYKSGNGLVVKDHLAKYLTKQYVYTSEYAPPDYLKTSENQVYMIAPMFYKTLANNFMSDYSKLQTKQLHIDSIGSMLYGDYSGEDPVTRTESKAVVSAVLKDVKDNGYILSIGNGNVYTLKYADGLKEIPTTTSNSALESYSIPFVGMVLHGYIDYSGSELNQQSNYQKALLQNIRSGAGLNFLLMTNDPLLLENTKYSDLFSIYADNWFDEITSTYTKLNDGFASMQNCTIVNDERISLNVYRTTYSNGKSVIVNFNSEQCDTPYGVVDGMGYLFVN